MDEMRKFKPGDPEFYRRRGNFAAAEQAEAELAKALVGRPPAGEDKRKGRPSPPEEPGEAAAAGASSSDDDDEPLGAKKPRLRGATTGREASAAFADTPQLPAPLAAPPQLAAQPTHATAVDASEAPGAAPANTPRRRPCS